MEDPQPPVQFVQPVLPPPMAQLPQTPAQHAPAQRYIYITTIKPYPLDTSEERAAQTPLPTLLAAKHYTALRALHAGHLRAIPATRQQRRKEASVSETLLGCGALFVVGLLVIALLFYLSTAR